MDPKTVDVYEANASAWVAQKQRPVPGSLGSFAARAPRGVRGDLGSGPGWHSAALGSPVVALDAAFAMLERVPEFAPDAWRVQGDLERLPFRVGALSGAWAHKSYMHVPAERVPMALADLHRAVALGGAVHLQVTCAQLPAEGNDPFTGRHFTHFTTAEFREIVEGAGFEVLSSSDDGEEWIDVEATRAHLLPDTVGAGMRVLVVGLNPSILSADKGFGFARPGNRFWPAAVASGLVTEARNPSRALRVDGVGMTNLVRRPSRSAAELTRDEYREGAARLERLCAWLRPGAVCFLGVTGYRVAVDDHAQLGWQDRTFGGSPVYVMPNPSGLNAHANPADFVDHFRAVQEPRRSA